MKLSFYARGTDLVRLPGVRLIIGQPPRYVGREHKVERDSAGRVMSVSNPAVSEALCIDADTTGGQRLVQVCRRDGSLWAADKETAATCGVKFVEVEYDGGEWIPKRGHKTIKKTKPRSVADG